MALIGARSVAELSRDFLRFNTGPAQEARAAREMPRLERVAQVG
jgi:hypothetical protein